VDIRHLFSFLERDLLGRLQAIVISAGILLYFVGERGLMYWRVLLLFLYLSKKIGHNFDLNKLANSMPFVRVEAAGAP
jgi:hypothetical protein